jgi:DNA-binding transcriptional LysR family regulator
LTRTTRSVALTDAGRTLLHHVPAIRFSVGQALAETRAAASGAHATLVVGMRGVTGLDLPPRVLRAFSAEHSAVEVTVRNVEFGDASAGLASGATDVALAWLPTPDGVDGVPLLEDRLLAVLPAEHPLARQAEVDAADLAEEPFVWIEDMDARVRDYWTLGEYRGGRPVKVGARITGFEGAWAAVRAGQAVAVSPAAMLAALSGTDVVTRPVRGLGPAVLGVCRRIGDDRELVRAFIEIARREAGVSRSSPG